MTQDIVVRKWRRIDPEEAAEGDVSRVGVALLPGPERADVVAAWRNVLVLCPCCGGLNRVPQSDTEYITYRCVWCGCLIGP